MKKTLVSVAAILAFLSVFIIAPASAEETPKLMPDISINYAFLYNLETERISKAPSIDMTLITVFDGVLKGNFKAAFPARDNNESSFIGGPMINFNPLPLISNSSKIKIVKDFQLEMGIGVLFDIFHVDGLKPEDLKKITYPTLSLGFSF